MKFFRFVFGSTATAAKGVINRGFCSCIFMTGSSKADVWHEINARAKTACLKGWAGSFLGGGRGSWLASVAKVKQKSNGQEVAEER